MRKFLLITILLIGINTNSSAYDSKLPCPNGENKAYVHKQLAQKFRNSNNVDIESVHHKLIDMGLSDTQAIDFLGIVVIAARAADMQEIDIFNYAYKRGKELESAGNATLVVGMGGAAVVIFEFMSGDMQNKFNGLNDFLNKRKNTDSKYYKIISGKNYMYFLAKHNEIDISGMMNIAEAVAIKNAGGHAKFSKLSIKEKAFYRKKAMEQTIKYKNSGGKIGDLIVELASGNYISKRLLSSIATGDLKLLNENVRWSSADFQAAEGFWKEYGSSYSHILSIYASVY